MANGIRGTLVSHCVITDTVRAIRGNENAFDDAVKRIRMQYHSSLNSMIDDRDVKYRLVLFVDRNKIDKGL